MNTAFVQDERIGRLYSVLGPNELVLLRFSGSDHVNKPFEYQVEALALNGEVDFDALIGTHASVEITTGPGESRWFDGIVTKARWLGEGENGHRYDLDLRPWLWVADQRRQQKIYHRLTAPEIIEECLSAYSQLGAPHLENRLAEDYPELEYTVQYGESDMDFACRMMERFGINYYFRFEQGSHTMVLTDSVDAHDDIAGGERPYRPTGTDHLMEEHFWEWAPERNLVTGAVRLTDYNFKTPVVAMEVQRTGDAAYAMGDLENYEYPGDYLDPDQGKRMVALRTDQERSRDKRHRAVGDCVSLSAGMRVSLGGDPVPSAETGRFVCLSATHAFTSNAYGTGQTGPNDRPFSGSYVLTPATAPVVPRRKTAPPRIHGPQTAIVVGEDEIDCDEYGRILVRFHWDIAGAHSMRCRVSQIWAGGGWGGITLPRVGMEVVVEFLEGDPDKPLVTGTVYNGKNGVPYDLPGDKTRMSIKSKSHNQGGFNELRFEDSADNEEIFLHAQKDHNTVIENDESHTILNDRTKSVTRDQTEWVGRNKVIAVDGTHQEVVKGDYTVAVTEGDRTDVVETGTQTRVVKGDDTTVVQSGDQIVSIESGDQTSLVKGNVYTESQSGTIKLKASDAIILEAPNIVLKANGGNFISLSTGTVVVEGGQTLINPRESAPDT